MTDYATGAEDMRRAILKRLTDNCQRWADKELDARQASRHELEDRFMLRRLTVAACIEEANAVIMEDKGWEKIIAPEPFDVIAEIRALAGRLMDAQRPIIGGAGPNQVAASRLLLFAHDLETRQGVPQTQEPISGARTTAPVTPTETAGIYTAVHDIAEIWALADSAKGHPGGIVLSPAEVQALIAALRDAAMEAECMGEMGGYRVTLLERHGLTDSSDPAFGPVKYPPQGEAAKPMPDDPFSKSTPTEPGSTK